MIIKKGKIENIAISFRRIINSINKCVEKGTFFIINFQNVRIDKYSEK